MKRNAVPRGSLYTASLSQGFVFGAASGGEGKWDVHSKDRERGEEPPFARVQLARQLVVPSSP